jgi:serine/threonine-protein kinase
VAAAYARVAGVTKRIVAFVRELRRRRVFRVVAAYALVSWGLVQLGDTVFPALNLPDWTLTLVIVLLAFGFPIALLLAWAFDLGPSGIVRADAPEPLETAEASGGSGASAVSGHPELDSDALAVLPFANLSADRENEYFSDGISEDLLVRLCSVGRLRVISRASSWQYKEQNVGARRIAAELGVAFLVGGSVRRDASNVRISAHLTDARSDRQVWSETYDRRLEDIFAIQSDVASRIAAALHRELGGSGAADAGPAAGAGSPDLEAYDEYLKGRFHWNRRTPTDLERSVEHFRASIASDPDFARAHAALAEAHVTQAVYGLRPPEQVMPAARHAAEEALRHESDQPSALSALASVRAIFDWHWKEAEEAFRSAIAAHPQYPTAPQWYATNVLVPLGRFAEADVQLDRARAVDPKSTAVDASRGVVAFMRRDFGGALEHFGQLVQRHPDFTFGHYYRGLSALELDRTDEAMESLRLAAATGGWSAEITAALGCACAAAGRTDEANEILASLVRPDSGRYVSPVRVGQLRAALGDASGAVDELERAASTRASDLVWIDVSPSFDSIRAEPRFRAVRDRVFGSDASTGG